MTVVMPVLWATLVDTSSCGLTDIETRALRCASISSRILDIMPDEINYCFKELKKCQKKSDCLVNEMLYIKQLGPSLNKQSDSLRVKEFMYTM